MSLDIYLIRVNAKFGRNIDLQLLRCIAQKRFNKGDIIGLDIEIELTQIYKNNKTLTDKELENILMETYGINKIKIN